jgi:hypothetical protein
LIKSRPGGGDHALGEIGLDECTADSPIATGVAGHESIGKVERRAAPWVGVVEHVLDPCEVQGASPSSFAARHLIGSNGGIAVA